MSSSSAPGSRQPDPSGASNPRTLFRKVWDSHLVSPPTETSPAVLYIDLHLIHEVTSPQAFSVLRQRGIGVRRPERILATMDHSTPTTPRNAEGKFVFDDPQAKAQLDQLEDNCREFGIELHELGSPAQGIVHVIGPELGRTQPGMTVVCGDSHTSTHGAFGALAFGIGTSEVGHVLATQTLLQSEPKTLGLRVDGALRRGVSAKDIILAICAKLGVGGATGHVIEYFGDAIRALNMEERMTVCNMSIEAGARAGMIAPDDTTFQYLSGREHAPRGAAWEQALERWKKLPSDEGALFDQEISLNASDLAPMITWGTNPGMGMGIRDLIPENKGDPNHRRALEYMGLEAGKPLLGHPVDVVFVGSCTNSRLGDLRQAASILRGHKVAQGVRMLVVPGSQRVKAEAEAEGLHRVFLEAGAEWREPGCSMCIGMNGDQIGRGQVAVSTSNRNFEGRQGAGGRTLLASPLTAAASAIHGKVSDPRELLPAEE